MDPQTSQALKDRGLTIAMPFYGLAKSEGFGGAPTKAAMTERIGRWISGQRVDDPQGREIIAPRGIATIQRLSRYAHAQRFGLNVHIEPGCTLLGMARSLLVTRFLETTSSDWLLFLDDDVLVAPETIATMIDAASYQSVVFVAYPQRMPPHEIPIITRDQSDPLKAPVRTMPTGERLLSVAAGPLGCCIIPRTILAKLVTAPPDDLFFEDHDGGMHVALFKEAIVTLAGSPKWMGEDVSFLFRVGEAGYAVECLADADVSHDGWGCNVGRLLDERRPYEKPALRSLSPDDPRAQAMRQEKGIG